jgi:hypothetical protein
MAHRDHLQAIYEEYGRLTPTLVVDVARPEDHPLHSAVFDRAPDDAAEAWYHHRAHELIRSVRISYESGPQGARRDIRQWHAVRAQDGNVYEPAEKIAADPFQRELLLRDMEREWKQMRARYAHMEEFIALVRGSLEEHAA